MLKKDNPIPSEYTDLYREQQIKSTAMKFGYITLTVVLIQIIILIHRIFVPFSENATIMTYYYGFYVISLILGIILIIVGWQLRTSNQLKPIGLLIFFTFAYLTMWALGVAIADQLQGDEIVIYYSLLFLFAITFEFNTRLFATIVLPVHMLLLTELNMLQSRGYTIAEIADSSTQIVLFVIFIHFYVTRLHKKNFIHKQDLIKLNKALELSNMYDSLSGVYNRGYWEKQYIDHYNRATEKQLSLAIVIIDIDYFKEYNDYYGHIEGDKIIRTFGKILEESAHKYGAIVGRFGGDEFIAVFDHQTTMNTTAFSQEIESKVLSKAIEHVKSKTGTNLTISQGVHIDVPKSHDGVWDFVASADKVLYEVKSNRK